MIGTTAECVYIGGHKPGFDNDCFWCVNAKRNAYGTLFTKIEPVCHFCDLPSGHKGPHAGCVCSDCEAQANLT